MHTLSLRDLNRRWFGQILAQPDSVAQDIRYFAAHTITPSDYHKFGFESSNFVPISMVHDVVLTSELNSADEVVGLTLQTFKSTFDAESNRFQIGGDSNLIEHKDLRLRPIRYGHSNNRYVIDSINQPALLLHGMDLESEREISYQRSHYLKYPVFAEPVAAFPDNQEPPKNMYTDGLKSVAWSYLQANSVALPSLCAPESHNGVASQWIRSIHRDRKYNITLVELNNYFCIEVPSWVKILVEPSQQIKPLQRLAAPALPYDLLDSFWKSNKTVNGIWNSIASYLGEEGSNWLLKTVFTDKTIHWAGMTLIPTCMLTSEQLHKCSGVWRDLRSSLGRVCHNFKNVNEVVSMSPREGKISIWNIDDVPTKENMLFYLHSGKAELFSSGCNPSYPELADESAPTMESVLYNRPSV
jgi:hypothetical protein